MGGMTDRLGENGTIGRTRKDRSNGSLAEVSSTLTSPLLASPALKLIPFCHSTAIPANTSSSGSNSHPPLSSPIDQLLSPGPTRLWLGSKGGWMGMWWSLK